MKKVFAAIILVGVAIAAYAYRQYLKAKDYDFQFLKIIITKLSLNEIAGFIAVSLTNKTDFSATLLAYRIDISAAGKLLGTASSQLTQVIAARSTASIDIAFASTSLNNLLDSVVQTYINSNNVNLMLHFTGQITVQFYHKTIELPVNYSATIKQLMQ